MKFKIIFLLIASLFVFAGCDNFEKLNTDPSRSSETQPEFLLASAQKKAMDLTYDTYFNGRIGMELSQYWMGTDKTSDGRFLFTNDGLWTGMYSGPLMDLQEIQNYYDRHPTETSVHTQAVAEILKSWIFHVLTDVYVDIPYTQALKGDDIPQPVYDKGKDVYTAILASLKKQIDVLSGTSSGAIRGDVIAGGSATQWIKIANALRLRIALRMADAQPAEAKVIIEEAVKNTITAVSQDVFFPYNVSAVTSRFPYNDVDRPLVEFAVTSTLVDYLTAVKDPRLAIYARPDETNGKYIGKVYGTEANSPTMIGLSKPGVVAYSGSAKGYMITYAEVAFIKAEAAARGMTVGTATAEDLYKEAVTASMTQWGITDAKAIATYLEGVPYKAGNYKNVIGTQKWLALYMQGIQGWMERLRLDIKKPNGDILFIAPASGSLDPEVKDGIVKRLKYPSGSRASNATNSEAAAKSIGGDSQATKNWWDVL
ncbi:SusD/RagB family nutrient-binding outer membrane lipoprotein [Dyadobacter psychrotolerans]|uniref:SusD/RagB family nutrient-binding outer membrane lipoprotein n=1 Tax=Dyadobacter psychrotolerans TaxID=2541721 RepID=A0A4R5DU02_9BACT|nr:SusD/RagB family nutrient-binding outer membrane lipoprotein [Dyadobacter psychrotolerans]TDE14655.1 SusD/RagB family nutrient-binding outer membrane lipoprotein [Dyadobacter psychrotolerans]